MNRPYLVLVNNVLAKACLTKAKALRTVEELKQKGYNQVSFAYALNQRKGV